MIVDIMCIGTPTVVGDSFGPIVGTLLKAMKEYDPRLEDVNIIGCISDPVTNRTYSDKSCELRDGAFVIAVDAAISSLESRKIGEVIGTDAPVIPGRGVGKENNPVGNFSYKFTAGRDKLQFLLYDKTDVIGAAALATALAIIKRIEKMESTDC